MKIVIAPAGFKESLEADEVASCIAEGFKRVFPDAWIIEAPMVDGGEGFTKALVKATHGELCDVEVTGPVGEKVRSHFGFLGGRGPKTAVIEMAAAAGLRMVPRTRRDPLKTTTYGVGELIKAALDCGAEKILVGCGDGGTNDGGIGAVAALGVRLLDRVGNELEYGGESLEHLHSIDISKRDKRLEHVQIDVALNWHNLLCGERGVARIFGPQKGASEVQVERLSNALDRYAEIIERDLGVDVRLMAGGGASGGLGAGLHAMLGANLHPRFDIVMQYLKLDSLLEGATLAVSAEGSIDYQTPLGKVPTEVARRASQYGVPTIVLAGTLGKDVNINLEHNIDAFNSIMDKPRDFEDAVENAAELLTNSAEHAARMMKVGMKMSLSNSHEMVK